MCGKDSSSPAKKCYINIMNSKIHCSTTYVFQNSITFGIKLGELHHIINSLRVYFWTELRLQNDFYKIAEMGTVNFEHRFYEILFCGYRERYTGICKLTKIKHAIISTHDCVIHTWVY